MARQCVGLLIWATSHMCCGDLFTATFVKRDCPSDKILRFVFYLTVASQNKLPEGQPLLWSHCQQKLHRPRGQLFLIERRWRDLVVKQPCAEQIVQVVLQLWPCPPLMFLTPYGDLQHLREGTSPPWGPVLAPNVMSP